MWGAMHSEVSLQFYATVCCKSRCEPGWLNDHSSLLTCPIQPAVSDRISATIQTSLLTASSPWCWRPSTIYSDHEGAPASKWGDRLLSAAEVSSSTLEQPRRAVLLSAAAAMLAPMLAADAAGAAADVPPARIDLSRAPDQRSYDATDSELRAAANALQNALNATTVEEEERLWTELIGVQHRLRTRAL